jgi:rSAM/selenodomain-associated transferase 1
MHGKHIILLFIKAPIAGQVKVRLAADVGDAAAVDLYKSFILDIVSAVEKSSYPFRICFHPQEKKEAVSTWIGPHYAYMPQQGDHLGKKMEDAFSRIFSEGFSRCVLIGSDIPDLPSSILKEAFESLENNDAVIGPAADGGYYLIGFNQRSFLPLIFQGIAWSTDTVFRETVRILNGASLNVHVLPQWRDVDTLGDLQLLFERNRNTAFTRSTTMTYLLNTRLLKKIRKNHYA